MSALMMMRNRSSNSTTKPSVIGQTRADYMPTSYARRSTPLCRQAAEIAYHHPNPACRCVAGRWSTPDGCERSPQDRNFKACVIGAASRGCAPRSTQAGQLCFPEYRDDGERGRGPRFQQLPQNVIHDVARPLHLFAPGCGLVAAEADQRPVVQGCCGDGLPGAVGTARRAVVAIITDDARGNGRRAAGMCERNLVDAWSRPGRR